MVLTGKQAHVLANLNRVEPRIRKINTPSPRQRFQLDGWDCTSQITSLVVKRYVAPTAYSKLLRLNRETSFVPATSLATYGSRKSGEGVFDEVQTKIMRDAYLLASCSLALTHPLSDNIFTLLANQIITIFTRKYLN